MFSCKNCDRTIEDMKIIAKIEFKDIQRVRGERYYIWDHETFEEKLICPCGKEISIEAVIQPEYMWIEWIKDGEVYA